MRSDVFGPARSDIERGSHTVRFGTENPSADNKLSRCMIPPDSEINDGSPAIYRKSVTEPSFGDPTVIQSQRDFIIQNRIKCARPKSFNRFLYR